MIQTIVLWILIPLIIINKSIAQNCEQVGCASGFCCSKWGFCGNTPLHCAGGGDLTNDTYIATCQPPCGPDFCCSRWGFCGNTPLHCAGTAIQTNDTYIINCQPPCRPGFCCSRWGFCGDTPLHCSGGGIIDPSSTLLPPIEDILCPPPCPAGLCCSKWGFCGNSSLHCDTSETPPTTTTTVTTTTDIIITTITTTDTTLPVGDILCPPPCPAGLCCSKWGFCGNSSLHCDTSDPPTTTTTTIVTPDTTTITTTTDTTLPVGDIQCPPPCPAGLCCSKWGFCGNSSLHCDTSETPPTTTTTVTTTTDIIITTITTTDTTLPIGDIPCPPPCPAGLCCSKWGFCGNSSLHCDTSDPPTTTTTTIVTPDTTTITTTTDTTLPVGDIQCPPPCPAGLCCSKWGFCGSSPLHCDGSETSTTAVATLTTTVTTSPIGNLPCPPPCPSGYCCSQWGFCGNTPEYCTSTSGGNVNDPRITRERFDCIFDQLDPALRDKRWQGFQDALAIVPFNQQNQNEVMMFFAHVAHETDGLQTYEEYCGQSGACANDYQSSWCPPVQAEPGKTYYGRGWFQLSWPCNYHNAGQALGIDFLKNPERVAESDALAAATAIWFWNANNMAAPARNGNFAGTTQIINRIECGPTPQQQNRIKRYQKVRKCFGLDEATDNLQC